MFNNINTQSTVRILNTCIKNGYENATCVTHVLKYLHILRMLKRYRFNQLLISELCTHEFYLHRAWLGKGLSRFSHGI